MNATARLKLKHPSGWFAAGGEVQRAATLLSDAAFKLFVWLCLHAERASGRLVVSTVPWAQALHKREDQIVQALEELIAAGVCRRFPDGYIAIQDCFWPYERDVTGPNHLDDESKYVAAIRRMFLSHACVRSSFTPADAKLACIWQRNGVPEQQIERAILLGVTRKYIAWCNNGTGTPITALNYFSGLIEQISHVQVSEDYWGYIKHKLPSLEMHWRKLLKLNGHPKETK